MPIRLEQQCRFLESDVETPISLFMRQTGNNQGILLESAAVDGQWGRYSLIADSFLLHIRCKQGLLDLSIHDARLEALQQYAGMPFVEGLRKVMQNLEIIPPKSENSSFFPPISRGLYGYLGYGMAGIFEPSLAAALPPENAETFLALPGRVILFDHHYNRIAQLTLGSGESENIDLPPCDLRQAPVTIGAVTARMSKQEYIHMVQTIQERIRQGEVIQVVPSFGLHASFSGDAFTLYRRLRRINPSPYMFFMRLPDGVLMGSSPEVLVGCHDDVLHLCPIAGTRPRGKNKGEDALFEGELASDPKEQAEHVMLVDLGRNDLGRVAETGSVAVTRFMEIERFSHVMHLTSHITAKRAPEADALAVLAAAFPAGTVSGAPKIRAMQIIAEFEKTPRGPYAGALGWIGLDKDSVNMDTGITIRSLWIRDGTIYCQAGGGVVLDSCPEAEWDECNNKMAAVLAAMRVDAVHEEDVYVSANR